MRIKIGDKIYHGEDEPIMVLLEQNDLDLLTQQPQAFRLLCMYPSDKYEPEDILQWMSAGVVNRPREFHN